jgi:hypothetical protein
MSSERPSAESSAKVQAPTAEEWKETSTAHAESAEALEAKKAEMAKAIESGDFAKVSELAAEAQVLESGTTALEGKKQEGFNAAYEEAHAENARMDEEKAEAEKSTAVEIERIETINKEIDAKKQELEALKASGNFAGIGEVAKQIMTLEAQKSNKPFESSNPSQESEKRNKEAEIEQIVESSEYKELYSQYAALKTRQEILGSANAYFNYTAGIKGDPRYDAVREALAAPSDEAVYKLNSFIKENLGKYGDLEKDIDIRLHNDLYNSPQLMQVIEARFKLQDGLFRGQLDLIKNYQ